MASSSAIAASKSLMLASMKSGPLTSVGVCLGDVAGECAGPQRHLHALALPYLCDVADDGRAVGVPADGISAPEHGQRAQAVEPCGSALKAGRRGMRQPGHRRPEMCVGRNELRPHALEAPADVLC